MHFYHRILLWDNNVAALRNNGKLNKKVKAREQQWWCKHKKPTYLQLKKAMNDIQNKIFPQNLVNEKVEGEHWKKINLTSIFETKSISELSIERKRKRDKTPGPELPRKRQKSESKFTKKRCRYKDKCRDYLKNGKCTFYHILDELSSMKWWK